MQQVAVTGGGSRAAEWAARFLASGLDVVVDDSTLRDAVAALWPAAQRLGLFPGASLERLRVAGSTADITDAVLVQVVAGTVPAGASGLVATESTGRGCSPIHLVPLVEVDGPCAAELAHFYRSIGMAPVGGEASEHDRWQLGEGLVQLTDGDPDALIAVMRSLRATGKGAGAAMAHHEAMRFAAGAAPPWQAGHTVAAPLALYHTPVEPEWVDYNGHMTEAAYLTAAGWASDALFRYIGDDEAYRAAGHSFYTVETHIHYLLEVDVHEPISFLTQVLGVDAKRLHLIHSMHHGHTGALLCTAEQMLVHVDMHAGRSVKILPQVAAALAAIAAAHAALPLPSQVGSVMRLPPTPNLNASRTPGAFMQFALSPEHEMIVDTVRSFTEKELMPHEALVEQLGDVPPDLVQQIKQRALDAGLYAANMPAELGGGGLDSFGTTLVDREFGATSYALQYIVARPSNILRACQGQQIEEYLLPTIRGERVDCMAMSEPDAGSDVRGMKCAAVRDGDDYVINGVKHFISHADLADYVILFAATGEEATSRGPKKRITGFLVDFGTPGCEVVDGYRCVSNRGYHNLIINFDNCRVPVRNILGDEHHGFDAANEWLGSTRLQVAAVCVGRARRALGIATEWAATRVQFGQQIGKFQGVSFKLADMRTQLEAAELLTLRAAWKDVQGTATDEDMAMAKVFSSEMCQMVTDEAIQILGGMGLMDELPLERMWRDTRVDRIWDGTSEIQRHIISRSMLRPYGA